MAKASEKQLLERLRSVPLFSGLDDKQLKSIFSGRMQRTYQEGQAIVGEGETGVGFYLILDGRVEVRRKGKVLSKLASGDFFGEMSVLDRSPRSTDIVAVKPTSCLVLSSWEFQGLLESNNKIVMNLLKTLVVRLRESNMALSD